MSELIVLREKLQKIYANYSIYIEKGVQFILGAATFYFINKNIGLMAFAATPVVTMALAVICTFLPPVFTALAAAALVLAHLSRLSLGVMGVTALIFVMMFIFYCQFTPRRAVLLLVTPLAFMMHISYVVPVVCGLVMTPVSAVPVVFGIVIYSMIACVKNSGAAITGVEGITEQISVYVKMIFQDRSLWVTSIAFIICILAVYVIRRLSVDHSWKIASAAGAIVNIAVMLAGDAAFGLETDYALLIGGAVLSIVVGLVLEFFLLSVDYSRTEHLQYEDDEYYYYVKAVPKLRVAEPEKKVKRINRYRDEEAPDRAEEQEARPGEPRRPQKRAGSQKSQSSHKVNVISNTEELLLARSLQDELDIDDIVKKELEQ